MKKLNAIFILIILFGCHHENNDFDSYFVLRNSLEINYNTLKDVNYYAYHFETDSLLTFFKDHKIIALDLKTGKEKINLTMPSHNGFRYRDHLYHNQDSIFVCSIIDHYEMCILLMNWQGVVYNKWTINSLVKSLPDGHFYIDANHSHPMVFNTDKLIFQASYRFKPGNAIELQVPTEIVLDLNTGHAKQIGDLPQAYKYGEFFGNHQYDYSRVINERAEFVFSFPSCHDLYVYDSSGSLLKTINCQSRYIDGIEPINKNKYTELSAIIDAYNYNAQYSDLVYDKYRKRYYRVVLHKLNKFDKDGSKTDARKRKWSIILIDEDFRKAEEFMMPVGVFWKRLIVTKQGIMLKLIDNSHSNTFQVFHPWIK